MKLVSWNVNGIRAIAKKEFYNDFQQLSPDVLCLQETKAPVADTMAAFERVEGYKVFANESKARKGYSGTAIICKQEPISVTYDMGKPDHDQEGRVVTVEFDKFVLVNVYVPNSGEGLKRLDYRVEWDVEFTAFCKSLESKKPVIVTGDLNVAHKPIDIARPKDNYNKSSGYTQVEIDGFQRFLDSGFVDTFRFKKPDEVKYSWWNYKFKARERNVGWRIDYFLVSEALKANIVEAEIHNEFFGSDHCPVSLVLDL